MEKEELLEIEARETAQAKKNIDEMVQRERIGDIHLLYKDKFDLEKKTVCFSSSQVPISMLIPLYERNLVLIPPFLSPEKFSEKMGFSVEQLMEWRKRGWVETLLKTIPSIYSGLSYLDELIRASPSAGIRIQEYLAMLAGGTARFDSIFDEGEMVFKELVEHAFYVESFGEQATRLQRSHIASNYVNLSVIGLTQIVEKIRELARSKVKDAELLCRYSDMFLVSPFLDSLKKTTVFSSEDKVLGGIFYEIAKPPTEAFFVPCWMADVYSNLEVTFPASMDIDEIAALRRNSKRFIRAVKSLDEEIDKAVREKFGGQALERREKEAIIVRKEQFRKRWFEDVVPALEDIRKEERMWSIVMTSSIIAPAIELPAFVGVFGIPATISALAASGNIRKLVDPAAEYLSTFWNRNPIHVGFYKVQKEVRKLKHKDK